MTLSAARTLLSVRTNAGEWPGLTNNELDTILNSCLAPDSTGLTPEESGYVATYHIARAELEVWTAKAAKASSAYDFDADGAKFDRSQVIAHCNQQADRVRRRLNTSL
jgi:hypothetical protein